MDKSADARTPTSAGTRSGAGTFLKRVKGGTRATCLDLWYRWSAASKIGFAADLGNLASILYSLWFSAYLLPVRRASGEPVRIRWIVCGAVAVIYATLVYPQLKGRLKKRKWKKEEIERTQAVGLALNALAAGAAAADFSELDLDGIEHRLLVGMASEVETLFQDSEGIYFAVCLQVLNHSDPAMMVVLNRSNLSRPIGVQYAREDVLAWRAMQTERRAYEPDFSPTTGSKPYKSILAFPIVYTDRDRLSQILGGVSVDSERSHHFDGYEEQVEILLAPYLGLLALVLVCRRVCNRWPNAVKLR